MAHELSTHQIERARTYLTSMDAYGPFSLTVDGRQMGGCMDTRADESGAQRNLIKVMGPGGAVGEGADHSTARTAVEGRLVPIEDGLIEDISLRRAMVHGGHHDCAYVNFLVPITRELAYPSRFTRWLTDKWVEDHELGSLLTTDVIRTSREASAEELAYLERAESFEHLLMIIDQAFPAHHNVPHMRGQPSPHFYTINGFPHLGLDRHKKHSIHQLEAQTYHDNVGARLGDIHNTHAIAAEVRTVRMAVLLGRSAAAATVIHRMKRQAGHPLEHLEIEIGDNGPVFKFLDPDFVTAMLQAP